MNTIKAGMMAVAGIIALGGCAATTTPETDARFGESFSILKAQQTRNPEASRNTDPVAGIDGRAAKGALDNYYESFRKPPVEGRQPSTQNNISANPSGN